MRESNGSARTRLASGRFLFTGLVFTACTAGPAPAPAPESAPPDPVIERGGISASREAQAAQLFRRAEEAFGAGRFDEAIRLTGVVIDRFASAPVSGRALLLKARAAAASGDATQADAAAERYIGLLPARDRRAAEVRLLQADALTEDVPASLDRLLRVEASASADALDRATVMARAVTASITRDDLVAVLGEAPLNGPIAPVALARYAVLLLAARDEAAAGEYARAALERGASGPDFVAAQGVLRGELPGGRRPVTAVGIATVLPEGGSPTMVDFARLVAEGVEVAAATVLGDAFEVEVVSRDDEGDAGMAAQVVRELENTDVMGAIGFLEDPTLEAAGLARTRDLPLVSPTARNASRVGNAVYSLEGPDVQAARAIAAYAAGQGYVRVAIVHSATPESSQEADAFEASIQELGIPVVGRFAYAPGATFFEEEILGAQNALRAEEIAALDLGEEDTLFVEMLEPVALFVPIPPEDVEFVAPQLTHFGLDTLAIQVLGTSGWTDPRVLETVDPRHTTGVVATARDRAGPGYPGHISFQAAYESYFQRSLVSPIPAVGYDAALLLLEAIRSGADSPGGVRAAFQRLRDIDGATGIYSVIDGRVVPRTEVIYIDDRTLVPIG